MEVCNTKYLNRLFPLLRLGSSIYHHCFYSALNKTVCESANNSGSPCFCKGKVALSLIKHYIKKVYG